MRRFMSVAISAFAMTVVALADVDYSVTFKPADKRIEVKMTFTPVTDVAVLQLPNWAPGAYVLRGGTGRIKDLKGFNKKGFSLGVVADNPSQWTLAAQKGVEMTVSYSIDATPVDDRLHFSGPSTYLYVVGQKDEKCGLSLSLPEGWSSYCGLDNVGKGADTYTAPTYDVLADNPVSVGKLTTDTYTSHGVPHFIVYHTGDVGKLDRAKTVSMCKYVSDSEGDFFGGLPFKKYIWHFNVIDSPGGGGGLEHLNSTEITLATGLSESTQSVLAHEYFHAWNVKRIRSSVLGPFDYTQLPKTGALWWLEGVTDYYASLLTFRYGRFGEPYFFGEIVKNVQNTRSVDARMQVSPYDSSYRVGEANNGRGNSNGYLVSYYNTGWLVGLCLDIEVRSRTGGKKSLDDVEKVLWNECKNNQPGFPEDGIRQALVKVAGPGIGDVYDRWVMKPGELPVEAQLAKVGLEMTRGTESFVDTGFDASAAFGGVRVRRVRNAGGLQAGDSITQINDTVFTGLSGSELSSAYRKVIDAAKPGDKLAVKYVRGEAPGSADVTVTQGSRDVFKVSAVPGSDKATLSLREGWYRAGKKPIAQG